MIVAKGERVSGHAVIDQLRRCKQHETFLKNKLSFVVYVVSICRFKQMKIYFIMDIGGGIEEMAENAENQRPLMKNGLNESTQ